jgi:hypothetical protein
MQFGLIEERPLEFNSSDLRHIVVAHTGQSSQLFPVTTGRKAQFLATDWGDCKSRLEIEIHADPSN